MPPTATTITTATASLVDLEVETVRTDAIQSFLKQETIFVELGTADGLAGRGYSYTIGTGGRAVLSMLRETLLPAVIGLDSRAVERVWRAAFDSSRATTVGPITSLALAALDTALWDLRCLRDAQPLWLAAGGFRDTVPLYDTEGGWLHLGTDELVENALRAKAQGWSGVKLKVGRPSAREDAERVGAVRDAVGPGMAVMVDANQSLTLASARARTALLEPFDLTWYEEPMPAEDVTAHAELVRSTSVPIAVGESIYSVGQFKEYLQRGAAGIVQTDVARIGGITPWLKVAHLAEAYNVTVCPHFLMELHVSLTAAIPNGGFVEHIPQLRAITTSSLRIVDGHAVVPDEPGLGIAWDLDAIEDRRVA